MTSADRILKIEQELNNIKQEDDLFSNQERFIFSPSYAPGRLGGMQSPKYSVENAPKWDFGSGS